MGAIRMRIIAVDYSISTVCSLIWNVIFITFVTVCYILLHLYLFCTELSNNCHFYFSLRFWALFVVCDTCHPLQDQIPCRQPCSTLPLSAHSSQTYSSLPPPPQDPTRFKPGGEWLLRITPVQVKVNLQGGLMKVNLASGTCLTSLSIGTVLQSH